jgi:oligopeptide/dipeptide ABC transporter ATP-binding protein
MRLVEEGPAEEVVHNPQHPYTRALLSVVPRRDPRDRTRPQILSGETPDAVRIPSGCRFHPRCPVAIDDCSRIDPVLERRGTRGRRITARPASSPDGAWNSVTGESVAAR